MGLLAALALPAVEAGARAGPAAAPSPPAVRIQEATATPRADDPLTVYLMTMAPGRQIWERFGHNAIWIRDASTGEDWVWNWGIFSFDQVGFIPRLIRGEMLYSMRGFSLPATLADYRAAGRDVWVQELALTPEQERELDRMVRVNARPENRDYLYDYYLDNCSTRVRDALDAVLGGRLREAYEGVATGTTWRWHTLRLLEEDPWARAGIQTVLGNPGDETIDAWQEMFLPMRLRAYVSETTVPGPDGPRPLVVQETRLLDADSPPLPTEARRQVWGFLGGGLAGAVLMVLLGVGAGRGSTTARVGLSLTAGLWGAVSGLVGLLLVASYLTDHDFWHGNENLFQLDPLSLGVAAGAFLLLVRRSAPRWTVRLARVVAVLGVAGVVLKVLPGLDQANGEIVALGLPLNLAVAWALARTRAAVAPPAAS